ncbi:hypothetical protein LY76DRAFT_332615 [Colletotrichum caudatum]|nr:hypothetical protein LY76DRAFT_332615 [Colletotrichum caudatum]
MAGWDLLVMRVFFSFSFYVAFLFCFFRPARFAHIKIHLETESAVHCLTIPRCNRRVSSSSSTPLPVSSYPRRASPCILGVSFPDHHPERCWPRYGNRQGLTADRAFRCPTATHHLQLHSL